MTTARRTGATSLTTLAACVAAFIAIHALAPQWAHSAGLDFWEASDDTAVLQREAQRRQDIEDQKDRLAQQIAVADSIATATIDNGMSFDAAVDQIIEVNRDRAGLLQSLRSQYIEATTERQLWEHYLLGKVKGRLEWDPSLQADVLARLTCR